MNNQLLIENLTKFGLTRQEAVCYICLHQNGPMTGYEVAKELGVSRSNVYTSLSGLAEKGAANLQEGVANKYVALPAEEFLNNCFEQMNKAKTQIISDIPKARENVEGYLTIEGSEHILNKLKNMIRETSERLYLAASDALLNELIGELADVTQKGCKVVLISECDTEIIDELFSEVRLKDQGCIICYKAEKYSTQFRLIVDSHYVLTGEISGDKKDTALYSTQKNFVDVFKESMRNEIKVIQMSGGEKHYE